MAMDSFGSWYMAKMKISIFFFFFFMQNFIGLYEPLMPW